MRREKGITLGERLAVAMVSFVAAGVTATVIGYLAFVIGPVVTVQDAKTMVLWGVIASSGAGVAGFFLGGERAAHWFGVLWGTQEATERQLGLTLGIIVLVCAVIVFVTLT